ncbi:MAG: HD domain-containing protein [Oscillospiraceae bacterium]|nr:HD domain-containing protein [Oscillospiraceae bacterium]
MEMELPRQVEQALARLSATGYDAYIVGGCVRDGLMGVPPGDYDIASNARPEEVARVFADARVIETGAKHGTVTVRIDGMPLEITTFRHDGAYSDGRRPDAVTFVPDVTEDLFRRDFTVNAMAYRPERGLLDPCGGREDIAARVIRCVGAPETRFREDALRILRALRFAAVLDFSIEPETARALCACRALLSHVSAERCAAELCKLLCGRAVRRVLLEYTDVLGVVLPELLPMQGFQQHSPYHIYDVLEHSAASVEHIPAIPVLRLAALLHDVGKPETFSQDADGTGHFYDHARRSAVLADAALGRLRLDNATRERVVTLIRWHDVPLTDTDKAVRRMLAKLSPEVFFQLLALKRADNAAKCPTLQERFAFYDRVEARAKDILARQDCFSLKRLAVNGDDLIAAGMRPGRAVGAALQGLLNAVMDGRVANERAALLELWARENAAD